MVAAEEARVGARRHSRLLRSEPPASGRWRSSRRPGTTCPRRGGRGTSRPPWPAVRGAGSIHADARTRLGFPVLVGAPRCVRGRGCARLRGGSPRPPPGCDAPAWAPRPRPSTGRRSASAADNFRAEDGARGAARAPPGSLARRRAPAAAEGDAPSTAYEPDFGDAPLLVDAIDRCLVREGTSFLASSRLVLLRQGVEREQAP